MYTSQYGNNIFVLDLYCSVNKVVILSVELCSIIKAVQILKGDCVAEKTYEVIKRTEYENRGGAPVYIDTGEVLRESGSKNKVMKVKLFNNCAKTVRSVYLNAGCFDKDLNLCVQLKNIPFINENAKPNTVFGNSQVVEVPEITQSVFAEVSKILFEDGSSWTNPNQGLSEDIVSEEALGEEWVRLRRTKEIKDRQSETEVKPVRRRMPANKKILIWAACIVCCVLAGFGIFSVQQYFSERQTAYKNAMNYYVNRDFENAAPALAELDGRYMYRGDEAREIQYSAAMSYMNVKDYRNALTYFHKCGNYKKSVDNMRSIINAYQRLIGAGYSHSAVVHKDGSVTAVGDNSYGQCDTGDWSGIIGLAVGGNHTIGMTYDGFLVASGNNEYGQCDVSGWTDIVSVATGDGHTVALKANGRVIARGNNEYGQCDVQEWSDIVQIAVSANHTIGLKKDGTVLAVGWNDYGQCSVEGETDVLYIATGERNTVLVKYDGSVTAVGDNSYDQCDTAELADVVTAAVGSRYIVYVDAWGKVKSKGLNDKNQGSVSLWSDVMAASCGSAHTLGLSYGGGIYGVGTESDGRLKLSNLANIGAENIPFSE